MTERKGEGPTLTDLHSHLVPGVDDGARTLEDALEGIGRMVECGIGRIVTTPHLDGRLTRDPVAMAARMKAVDRGWELLREAVARDFPRLELHRGHEVKLDTPDPDLSDPRVRLAGTSWVLVEWPRLQVPAGSTRAVARLVGAGWRPLVAHPERYGGMDGALDLAGEWRVEGALLQVNHGSLVGRYGEEAQRRAWTLLQRGWVDVLSTDFHGRRHLELHVGEAEEALLEVGGADHWRLVSQVNPGRLVRGAEPVPVPPLSIDRGIWGRVKTLLRGDHRERRGEVGDR